MANIQIYGIEGHDQTQALKRNTQMALEVLSLDLSVEEIFSIDQLLNADLLAIPALKVDGKIIIQREVPSTEDLIILFKVLFKNHVAVS